MTLLPSTVPAWSQLLDDPAEDQLSELTTRLESLDGPADEHGQWPEPLWSALVEQGAPLWSLPPELGGQACGRALLLQRYARVAEGSLTAAFILSQHEAGVRRLAAAPDRPCAREWLGRIAAGTAFTTVGISHLTTSKRLGDSPMSATSTPDGFLLNGAMPWVTAACRADIIVTGAPLSDGRQIMAAVPSDRPGLTVLPSFPLAALQASCTAEVACDGVHLDESDLLAGPDSTVTTHPSAAGTGGLETSAIALGQARAALAAIFAMAPRETPLFDAAVALSDTWMRTWAYLMTAAEGLSSSPTSGQVRGQANTLVLRATQSYLTARKGSGFLRTEPAQRWARQALFFLVWSCPSPVAQAAIRDLAGLCST
jgi:butyryl-CoA dehydrogenase